MARGLSLEAAKKCRVDDEQNVVSLFLPLCFEPKDIVLPVVI
jgi:hypothetical protein